MKSNQIISGRLALMAACSILLAITAGCSTSRVELGQSTSTAVALTSKNYRLVKAGAEGESHGFRLLGIIPFASPHYSTARQSLYASVGEPLTGKAIALVNETRDKSTLYLVLFSIPKYTIAGDVIEFVDKPEEKRGEASPVAQPNIQ
jgi:hypothetical protein